MLAEWFKSHILCILSIFNRNISFYYTISEIYTKLRNPHKISNILTKIKHTDRHTSVNIGLTWIGYTHNIQAGYIYDTSSIHLLLGVLTSLGITISVILLLSICTRVFSLLVTMTKSQLQICI